jgi:hypothetical protein
MEVKKLNSSRAMNARNGLSSFLNAIKFGLGFARINNLNKIYFL